MYVPDIAASRVRGSCSIEQCRCSLLCVCVCVCVRVRAGMCGDQEFKSTFQMDIRGVDFLSVVLGQLRLHGDAGSDWLAGATPV